MYEPDLDQHRFGNNSSFLNDISTTSTFQPSSNRQYSSANLNSSTSTPARTSASPTFLATTRFPPQKLPTPSKQILGFDSISTSHRRQHLNNQGGRSPTNGTTYPNGNRSETNSPQAETQESANPRRPQSSASNPSSPQAVDGREFFRIARQTLSYDEFTILLWNVKAYNNREQTRQKTIENLNILLGTKHKSLFERFEKLLMNGSSNSSAK
ncbi:hypothetical protein BKA69DRAFT_182176 [Paraphysoderma sedebokerense]|nr:hypothetical protein BKA69DRAFT_182176 [Paraphysoderma sedebokerense]